MYNLFIATNLIQKGAGKISPKVDVPKIDVPKVDVPKADVNNQGCTVTCHLTLDGQPGPQTAKSPP